MSSCLPNANLEGEKLHDLGLRKLVELSPGPIAKVCCRFQEWCLVKPWTIMLAAIHFLRDCFIAAKQFILKAPRLLLWAFMTAWDHLQQLAVGLTPRDLFQNWCIPAKRLVLKTLRLLPWILMTAWDHFQEWAQKCLLWVIVTSRDLLWDYCLIPAQLVLSESLKLLVWVVMATWNLFLHKLAPKPLVCLILKAVQLFLWAITAAWRLLEWVISRLSRRKRDSCRREQEKEERTRAKSVAKDFAASNDYTGFQELKDLGSRLQKLWYSVREKGGRELVVTLAPVSSNCPIILTESQDQIAKFLRSVEHPFLQEILKMEYDADSGFLIIAQPLIRKGGSLKDLIYKVPAPILDWSAKYATACDDPLSTVAKTDEEKVKKIARYGRQILEATLYLYSTGLCPVGHIHSGNVYVDVVRDVCLVGGYENRLVGYRTRLYSLCRDHNYTEDIDIIMIGCLIFEMACGYELTTLVPEPEDYAAVQFQAVRDVLFFIFRRDKQGNFLSTMEQILALDFFQLAEPPTLEGVAEGEWPCVAAPTLSRDVRHLVAKIMKGKPRQQTPNLPKKKPSCKIQ